MFDGIEHGPPGLVYPIEYAPDAILAAPPIRKAMQSGYYAARNRSQMLACQAWPGISLRAKQMYTGNDSLFGFVRGTTSFQTLHSVVSYVPTWTSFIRSSRSGGRLC